MPTRGREAVALGKVLVEPLDRNKNRAVQTPPKPWRGGRHLGVPKRKPPRWLVRDVDRK